MKKEKLSFLFQDDNCITRMRLVGSNNPYEDKTPVLQVGEQVGAKGIDIGRAYIVKVYDNNIVLAKVKGRKEWAGIGWRAFHATCYWIIKFNSEYTITKAFSVEIGRHLKEGMQAIEKKVNQLQKKPE